MPTEIPLNAFDPAVLAAAFAVQLIGNGPEITPGHVCALVSWLATSHTNHAELAAKVAQGYAVLQQECAKSLH